MLEPPSKKPRGVGPSAGETRPAARLVFSPAERDATLRELIGTLYDHRWLAASVAAGVLLAAIAYLLLVPRVYESHVVVQVEDNTRTLAGLEQLSTLFSDKRPAEPEMAIMRSQTLLGSVVEQLALDVEAGPDRGIVDQLLGRGVANAIRVTGLAVSDDLLDQPLVLTALGGERFRLDAEDGTKILEGAVAQRVTSAAGGHHVELVVSQLVGPPSSRFAVQRHHRDDVIERLRKRLVISENGRGTGTIDVALESGDAKQVTATLNAFASAYLRQNVERKSAEAQKTLEFLEQQIPIVKGNLDRSENALESFQKRKGTVSLSQETESVLNQSATIDSEISGLELQRTELRQRFTDQYPLVVSVTRKLEQLRAKKAGIDARMHAIPTTELESARLTRDQKSSSQMYDFLLNKAQELRVVRSGIIGNVHILDWAAEPRRPAWPKTFLVLALGVVLGLGGGIAAALVRRALDEGAKDPEDIEARVGIPVYVTIPHTSAQKAIEHKARTRHDAVKPLALTAPDDVAVESLRSLRTALQFALFDSRNNVIAIGSPSPGAGKSFVCANLAVLLATAGHRVLLVDADIRRGRLHRSFSIPRQPGLSELLIGSARLDAAIRVADSTGLRLLPTGKIPPNPSELLASQRFQEVIDVASAEFDFVLLDTPPVLAVTDSTLVARCAGVNLLVLRAGQHPYREISLAVKQFTQNGFPVQGAILNDAHATRHGYGRYGRYYEYRPATS